ncbi:ubiquitin-conjugating enzyme/RWD-like protein [Rhodocollybia butyracea]|uniref:Ubiquitin-conjugating enzyme/RWD-like protein n=1 Tax=Rhodocollybia butyracea TaxID=206335 RepID=A0A9P5Q048_9AGAR|nr:ubiquitin-conjugating enzyme/RWD-like protein [Rhodocollybia butyracea]
MFNPLSRPAHRPSKSVSQPTEAPTSPARAAIALEYASLRNLSHCPLGIYVVPSTETLMIWDAVLFVHQGYYSDSVLKFRIIFPPNYPERPPTVQFINEVFHPLISPAGIFSLTPQIRTWLPNQHHVFDVLHFVKAAFKRDVLDKIEEADCLNKEAYTCIVCTHLSSGALIKNTRRYHESTTSFAALATQTASLSHSASALYDKGQPTKGKPSHGMQFIRLKSKILKEEREKFGLKEWQLD